MQISGSRLLLLLLTVLIGGGAAGAWIAGTKPHSPASQGSDPVAHALSSPTVAAEAPASPELTQEDIEFPTDLWESAGLKVEPASSGVLEEAVELTGKVALNEDRLSHVFPLIEGRVEDVNVQFGQTVKQGDLMVLVQSKEVGQAMLQLYQDRFKLEFTEARYNWTQEVGRNTQALIEMMRAGATIDRMEEALKDRTMGDYREKLMNAYVANFKAQAHLDRLAPLSQTGAVPARQILEAESDLTATRATLQALLEQVLQDVVHANRLAEQSVKELKTGISVSETSLKILGFTKEDLQKVDPEVQGEAIAHYPVRAPFAGTVISKDVVLLERVGPDRQILTIADLSSVWITADVYEAQLPLLAKLGQQTIHFRSEAWPGQRFEAQVFYTGDVVQETTRTLSLRAVAKNPDGILKPGMFVTVELPTLNQTPVLLVPATALQDHAGRTFVFVQRPEGKFAICPVTVGRRNPQRVEIQSGLQAGDQVVTGGGFTLKSRMLADLLAE